MEERRGISFSGLTIEAERCPEASGGDAFTPGLVGGAIGFGVGLLLRAPGSMKLVAAAAGAAVGALASRYHLNLDWDPDALRGGSAGDGDEHRDAPLPPIEPAPEAH